MTQFAVFTGEKPLFKSYQAVPLSDDCVNDYIGDALNSTEKAESWVLRSPDGEVIDAMCSNAMVSAQLKGNILGTELYEALSAYLPNAKAVTFFYATESDHLPIYKEPELFINAITSALSGKFNPSMEVYAKYQKNT